MGNFFIYYKKEIVLLFIIISQQYLPFKGGKKNIFFLNNL